MRAWHYAHKPPITLACDPDLVLHRTAQELILSGFRNAEAQGGEYTLGRLCDRCNGHITRNVAKAGAVINREVSVVARTRSDLVVTYADGEQLVIEVVHTHDLDESAATAYSQSGIRVLKLRPTWLAQDDAPATVTSEPGINGLTLYTGGLAYDALNVGSCLCAGCKRREREEAAQQRREQERYEQERDQEKAAAEHQRRRDQEFFQSITSDLEKKVASIPANVIPCAVRWEKDPFGECLYLYPNIQNQLGSYGDILLAMGFVQAKEKPWLFFIKSIRGVIYADFGGTSTIPVLQYSGVHVYSQGLPPGVIGRIEGHTSELLKALGIPMLYDLYESNPPERLTYPRTRESQRREQERQEEERHIHAKERQEENPHRRWEEERRRLFSWANNYPEDRWTDESPEDRKEDEDRKKFIADLYRDASRR